MLALELQLLFSTFEVACEAPHYNLSAIIEKLCNLSLNDDEVGIAEYSRYLFALTGMSGPSLN